MSPPKVNGGELSPPKGGVLSPPKVVSGVVKLPDKIPYPVSIALVLSGCALVFSIIAFGKGAPSTLLAAIAKSGFTAAFIM